MALAERTDLSNEPLDLKIKELHSEPDQDSDVVFSIPIDVILLDVSQDANWYKVKIQYSFGPLCYSYVGWTKIPVTEILQQRNKKSYGSVDLQ